MIYDPKLEYGHGEFSMQAQELDNAEYTSQTLFNSYTSNACLGQMFGVPMMADETDAKPAPGPGGNEVPSQDIDMSGYLLPSDEELMKMLEVQQGGGEGVWQMGQQNVGVASDSSLDLGLAMAVEIDGDGGRDMDVDMFGQLPQLLQPLEQPFDLYATALSSQKPPMQQQYTNAQSYAHFASESFSLATPSTDTFPLPPPAPPPPPVESFPSFDEINTIPDFDAGGAVMAAPVMTDEELREFGLSLADYVQNGEGPMGGAGEVQSCEEQQQQQQQQQQPSQQQPQPAPDQIIFGDLFFTDDFTVVGTTKAEAETETESETNPSQPATIDWTDNDEWAFRLTGNINHPIMWRKDQEVGVDAGSGNTTSIEGGQDGPSGNAELAAPMAVMAAATSTSTSTGTCTPQPEPQSQPQQTIQSLLHRYPIVHFWDFPHATHSIANLLHPFPPTNNLPHSAAAVNAWAAIITTYTDQSNIRLLRAHTLLRWRILIVAHRLVRVQLVHLEDAGRETPVHDALWLLCAPASQPGRRRDAYVGLLADLAAMLPRHSCMVVGVAVGPTAVFFLWDPVAAPRRDPVLRIPCAPAVAAAAAATAAPSLPAPPTAAPSAPLDARFYAPITNTAVSPDGVLHDAAFWSVAACSGGSADIPAASVAGLLAVENVLLGMVNLRHPGMHAARALLPPNGAWMLPCGALRVEKEKKKRGRKKKTGAAVGQSPGTVSAIAPVAAAATATATAAAVAVAVATDASIPGPKKRGRKPGSKNKPKPPPDPNGLPIAKKTRKSRKK